ncbi:hypothetical protein PT974_10522 [Cladobotryum mycophilum]|uniref:Nephrocystin 3-like N-terminal domain-containing protein n=1 Tax=Cladobotryum mycophilum TaxID=491253 RepID=A0ABR0SA35_9HYPO
MSVSDRIPKVFRLRKLPNHVSTPHHVAHLLNQALGIAADHVTIQSIARTSDRWEASPSKVATLQFKSIPECLHPQRQEWEIALSDPPEHKIILDTHFEGFTVLNDVAPSQHHADLIYQLKSGGWNLDSSKSIVFLAHSLGGIVLKEVLVQIADRDKSVASILDNVQGAIMFGVPSLGMQQSHLMAMVEGQANDMLVQDLSRENGSSYLRQLNKSFEGITFTRAARIFWAYETKESRTVIQRPDGSWDRNGPLAVLVNPDSATCHQNRKSKALTIPINDDHTNMVKFSRELHTELYSPELDFRIDQIEEPFQDTFKWIFDLPIFCNWLHEGSGLFWIHGKPGSGKSTLMKFIYRSQQTWELLHDWRRCSHEITAGFFFHYRGAALQKSFEGVLRSLIIQILSSHSSPFQRLHQPTWNSFQELEKEKSTISGEIRRAQIRWQKVVTGLEKLHDSIGSSHYQQTGLFTNDYETILRLDEEKLKLEQEIKEGQSNILRMEPQFQQIVERFRPYQTAPETQFLTEIAVAYRENGHSLISKLERILRLLLDQNTISMDLILFFDALDEFDGHPDMISRFLWGLVEVPQTSKTRVKVCFSSRPWQSLQSHFSHYPNFGLQDYTKIDIEEYAARSLTRGSLSNRSIIELIPVIIARANGVFLWVKLAVHELLGVGTTNAGFASRQALEQKLQELPDDLCEFYELIIERISLSNRRRTFVLVELLIRQHGHPVTADHIRRAVITSSCSTYQEAEEELQKDNIIFQHSKHTQRKEMLRSDISTWGGGLVEVKGDHAQFMHQTVLEFVMDLSFKRSVLGDLAVIFNENGHSFHLKYWISARPSQDQLEQPNHDAQLVARIAYHAEQSELTTGNSHFHFLNSIPNYKLRSSFIFSILPSTPALENFLRFIASNGLTLSLRDWVETYSVYLRHLPHKPFGPQFPLLSLLVFSSQGRVFQEGYLNAARLLLENGYSVKLDLVFFKALLEKVCIPITEDPHKIPKTALYSLATLVAQHGQDPNIVLTLWSGSTAIKCSPLHIAPPSLVVELLKHSANVNDADSMNRTPLDWVLNRPSEAIELGIAEWDCSQRYELCNILLKAGGTAKIQNWKMALADFEREGYDTADLELSYCSATYTG